MTVLAQPLATPAAPSTQPPAVPTDPIYRLSVEQYHAMIDQGILTEDDPVELLEGWLVRKMSGNPPHNLALGLLQDALVACLPRGWSLRVQSAVTTGDSEPEPDVAVVRGSRRDYGARHPGAPDTAVVVEIANTTLRMDRTTKLRAYAAAGFPCYWLVNLVDRRIEVYTGPSGTVDDPGYAIRQEYTEADEIPLVLEGREIARIPVAELLP